MWLKCLSVVPDEFKYSGFCHCLECRKFSGSAFSAFAGIESSKVEITSGEELLSKYGKPREDDAGAPMSAATSMCFCSKCGSSMMAIKHEKGMTHLRMGTLDDTPTIHLMGHVHVASKAPWYEIGDNKPQVDAMPSKARIICTILASFLVRSWSGLSERRMFRLASMTRANAAVLQVVVIALLLHWGAPWHALAVACLLVPIGVDAPCWPTC